MASAIPVKPEQLPVLPPEAVPNIDHIVIEDGAPVDEYYSEKQMRLLTAPLYAAWKGRRFVASANVGLFFALREPPVVPDVMLSLDVELGDLSQKANNT